MAFILVKENDKDRDDYEAFLSASSQQYHSTEIESWLPPILKFTRPDLAKNGILTQVGPKLFLGDYETSKDLQLLRDIGITRICTVMHETELYDLKTSFLERLIVNEHDIPQTNLLRYFNATNAFIEGGVTLVHCFASASRSPTIVIAYLMFQYGLPLCIAHRFLASIHPKTEPNMGFMCQLIRYERRLNRKPLQTLLRPFLSLEAAVRYVLDYA